MNKYFNSATFNILDKLEKYVNEAEETQIRCKILQY